MLPGSRPPDRYSSSQPYLYLRLRTASTVGVVSPTVPEAHSTAFSAALSVAPVYFVSDNPCGAVNAISRSAYSVVALTSSWGYANGVDCTTIVYSGSPSLALKLSFLYFSTEFASDYLRVRDGDGNWSALTAQLSGSYDTLYVGVVVVGDVPACCVLGVEPFGAGGVGGWVVERV